MAKLPDALLDRHAYDEKADKIELLQTHISWVFLAGDYAYKVKKPVNFGFLDFSTLKKREEFCRREFIVNSMFSPKLYMGVLPITADGEKLKIGGSGKTFEYCIKMRRVSQENLMGSLLSKGFVGKSEIKKITKILLSYYEKAENGPNIDKNASFDITKFNWDENFSQTKPFRNISIESDTFDFIEGRIMGFLSSKKGLFEQRLKEGRARWCHGDLHSGNIFIDKSDIFIFDAIEFNERFACSDVASDIAFLSMDLEFRGFFHLSDYFIKEFVEGSKDFGIRDVIDFYRCYRAYVGGKVVSFRLNDSGIPEDERKKAMAEAKKYFELSKRYAERI